MSVVVWTTSSSPLHTERIGHHLGTLLEPGMVLGLIGRLGAGKTCLVGGVLKGLGINKPARSPTFSLINEYTGPFEVYHIDLYRLENVNEALDLGIEEILDGNGACLIEWSDKIEDILPKDRLIVQFVKVKGNGNCREIGFKPTGSRYENLVKALVGLLEQDDCFSLRKS